MQFQPISVSIQNQEQIQYCHTKTTSKLSSMAIQTLSEQMQRYDFDDIVCKSSSQQSNSQRQQFSLSNFQELNTLKLRTIKSKEEIEIESKENQTILNNLNFNIDDLFKKISSLTNQISTELSEPHLKQKQTNIVQQDFHYSAKQRSSQKKTNYQSENQQTLRNHKKSRQMQSRKQYKPIYFQSAGQKNVKQQGVSMKLFQMGKSLGYGKFGEVVQCKNLATGNLYALKKIFKSVIQQYNMQPQLLTQLQILSRLSHPNIIHSYTSFSDQFHIFILMQYLQGPCLTKYFRSPENLVKNILRQVLQGLKYLHENDIVHRDLKPENVIVQEGVVRICDFGWAGQGKESMVTLCGTLDYVAYEMVKGLQYTKALDLWNVGVLTYQLLYGYPPFKAANKAQIFQRVANLDYAFSDQISISQECKDFINGYLKPEPMRQTIQWGLNHPFLIVQSSIAESNSSLYEQQFNQLFQQKYQ